jgi:PadR family transcriptional regulator PadR
MIWNRLARPGSGPTFSVWGWILPLDNLQERAQFLVERLEEIIFRRREMAKAKADLLQGTLDMLILKTLALGAMHGWGIAQRIEQISAGVLAVNQGSLYPALYRLEEQGWIAAEWGNSENNRQAKFYQLTRAGRKQLAEETANWERMTTAINLILGTE